MLVGGLEHVLLSHSVGNFHPSQLTFTLSYFSEGLAAQNRQPDSWSRSYSYIPCGEL